MCHVCTNKHNKRKKQRAEEVFLLHNSDSNIKHLFSCVTNQVQDTKSSNDLDSLI